MSRSAKDDLASISTLEDVWKDIWKRKRTRTTPGVDNVSASIFMNERKERLREIRRNILEGYRFSPLRGVAIPKSDPTKLRLICVPTLSDRIVQRALVKKLEGKALQLRLINPSSFGFIKNTDAQKRGVSGAQEAACLLRKEKPWVFKADISKFFDRIDRKDLSDKFSKAFSLRSLTPLVLGAIQSEVLEAGERVKEAIKQNEIKYGVGLRQGMPLSPLLSNFVLRDFDQLVSAKYPMVRYADDLLVFADTEAECAQARKVVERELKKIGHVLSTEKSHLYSPDKSFDFLGMASILDKDGNYRFCLSKEQMASVRESIVKYHDITYAISEKMNIIDVLRKLDMMKTGYLSAYRYASNKKDFEQRLEQWMKNCCDKIYGSIFSQEAVKKLTPMHRRFLMLP